MARVAAGAFGFLTLIQVFDGPDRYAAQYRLAWRWTGKNWSFWIAVTHGARLIFS